jgi:hypothetical protein
MNNNFVIIVCINEPDISYTRNKPLVVNQKYKALYNESNLGDYGICVTYKVFNDDNYLLGEYFARDFQTMEENRNSKLQSLLEETFEN